MMKTKYQKLEEYKARNVNVRIELNSRLCEGEADYVIGRIHEIGEDFIELIVSKAVFLVFMDRIIKISFRLDENTIVGNQPNRNMDVEVTL